MIINRKSDSSGFPATMDKLNGWIAIGILLRLLAVITAQPGFLSINCGGKTNQTGENNIKWVYDANYIDVGEIGDIGNATERGYGSPLDSLRFFPKPLTKSCYHLPVAPNLPHLLRLWFVIGNYSGFHTLPNFAFSIETVDMLAVQNITMTNKFGSFSEMILVTSGRVLYVCLIRTFESDDPFISGIEMRALQDGMYGHAKPGTLLQRGGRHFAGNSTVRYPQDNFDRLWVSANSIFGPQNSYLATSEESVSTNNTEDLPPTAVLQNAWLSSSSTSFRIPLSSPEGKSLVLLYFAEVESLNMSESRTFYVDINGERKSENITLIRNHSALEIALESDKTQYDLNLVKAGNSTRPPILNAIEYYYLVDTQRATYSQDIDALDSIKNWFDIKDWISDPCYLGQWEGILCDSTSPAIRITGIDLSRRNLTGSVPNDIGQLTALLNVSLDNNHLMGSLPNLSTLAKLERLHLQNNNLSGTLPLWLSELKNLTELYIENNNFSGVIPAQLLINRSLKLNYSGNPYLCMHKGECIVKNSNKNSLKVVLRITLSGILIIAVALGIILYHKKIRKKEEANATESSRVTKEPKTFLYQDHTMIMVPNPTKSRAFTLDELITATQSFTQEIGRGGFGSVFFGKLPDGTSIAVKVLSLFSRQGAQEFLNEVDLLSRIHHRNLVSLLGYCNESREVMLIYEHMSGGSLSDHLYGARASHFGLNWKTRLKITLDAAQGLEYLHVGCTPKIIHRDIKTANILLDSNLNGKLADFGLSRMTIDGDATHVTTAVKGTAGYLDPEYYSTQMLTHKSDVYSFGVVLLEIICGRPPIDLKLPVQELNIVRWVTPYLFEMDENAGNITEIIDKRLVGGHGMKSICRVAKVAMRCIQSEPSSRPSVSEVVAELKASIPIAEESTAIESGDLLAGPVDLSTDHWSEPKGMTWGDNSSNISKVGR